MLFTKYKHVRGLGGLENARKVKERLRVLMEEKPEDKFPLIIL